jgi:DNA (cytosine-5)-methyltransferase 1
MSLGFEQAGFDVAAAVEVDPIHGAVHEYNFPNCRVLARSVVGLSGDEIRRLSGIGSKPVDVVFGGAPCQGFSLIGHRALDDPRNTLVREFVRIVAELKPAAFVFENVKGLTVGRHKGFLFEIVEAFGAAGYEVRLPWCVLNASHYGVPQSRERLFLVGVRKGHRLPEYPAPICRPAGRAGSGLPQGPDCQAALGDLPDADLFPALDHSDEVRISAWGEPSEYAMEMRCLTKGAWHFGHPRRWDPMLLTSSLRTDHTEISRRRFNRTPQGTVEPISRFFKLPSEGVSNTLRAGTDAARGAFTSPRPIHYAYDRCVTVREMARLHGFPDWFRFHETKWHGARQIGNAVPPPLARAVAGAVLSALGHRPERPERLVDLGDPALLQMGMNEASCHFGIVVPIARRDRKSGAKKRSQAETEAAFWAAKEASVG